MRNSHYVWLVGGALFGFVVVVVGNSFDWGIESWAAALIPTVLAIVASWVGPTITSGGHHPHDDGTLDSYEDSRPGPFVAGA